MDFPKQSGLTDEVRRINAISDSDMLRQSLDDLAKPTLLNETLRPPDKTLADALKLTGIPDMASRSLEELAKPSLFKEVLGQQGKSLADLLKPRAIPDGLRRSLSDLAKPSPLAAELQHGWDHMSQLSSNVDRALSHMQAPVFPTALHENFELKPRDRTPNPIWETNSKLSKLTETMTQLVEVARQQAELSQAISTNAELALKYAVQSGEDAKAASLLARKSVQLTTLAIIVAIVTTLASIGVSYRSSMSSEDSTKEEIRLLRDISGKLQQLGRPPAASGARMK